MHSSSLKHLSAGSIRTRQPIDCSRVASHLDLVLALLWRPGRIFALSEAKARLMGKMSIGEVARNHTGAPGLPCLMSGCGAVDASAVVQAL